jgi:hypothetical protein
MPNRLIEHIAECRRCRDWATRIARIESALALIGTSAPPQGIHGRANGKALRMLARKLRETQSARKLGAAAPAASRWAVIQSIMARSTATAAAATLVLWLQTALPQGMAETRDLARPLGDAHYARHIDDSNMLA